MIIQSITITDKLLNEFIPKELIESINYNDDIYFIPTEYWNNIKDNLFNYSNLNNDVEIINIIKILEFLLSNSYHNHKYLRNVSFQYKRIIKFLHSIGIINSWRTYNYKKKRSFRYFLTDLTLNSFDILSTPKDQGRKFQK